MFRRNNIFHKKVFDAIYRVAKHIFQTSLLLNKKFFKTINVPKIVPKKFPKSSKQVDKMVKKKETPDSFNDLDLQLTVLNWLSDGDLLVMLQFLKTIFLRRSRHSSHSRSRFLKRSSNWSSSIPEYLKGVQ